MTMAQARSMGFPCMQPEKVRARGSTSRAAAAALPSRVAELGRAGAAAGARDKHEPG